MALTTDGDIEILKWDKQTESLQLDRGLRRRRLHHGRSSPRSSHPTGAESGWGPTRAPTAHGWSGSTWPPARDRRRQVIRRCDIDPRSQVWAGLLEPLIQSRATGELLGVRYLGERQVIHALDPHFADVLANLEKLSDGDIGAVVIRRERAAVGRELQPRSRSRPTYLYDHATGESRLLFRPYPHLDPEALAPMTAGHDHLARRAGPALRTSRCPSVWSRRTCRWCWSCTAARGHATGGGTTPAVQLLANRGYAVLQVNFRGSTRIRQGVRQGRYRRVRRQDARRPHRRGELGGRAGLRRPGPRRDLRRLLRRLRHAGRRHVHPGRLRRRDRLRRHLEPGQLHAHAARRSRGRTWPTTGTCSSATPTCPRSWRPTCWLAHPSPRSTRSARRCW